MKNVPTTMTEAVHSVAKDMNINDKNSWILILILVLITILSFGTIWLVMKLRYSFTGTYSNSKGEKLEVKFNPPGKSES